MDTRWATLAVPLALLLLCAGLLGVFGYGVAGTGIATEEPRTVTVRRGESLTALSRRLADEGLLRHPAFFRVLAVLRGDAGRIKAGEYVLQGRLSHDALMDHLVSGDTQLLRLTIPEGYALQDIAAALEREGLGDRRRFLELAGDQAFLETLELPLALPTDTLEGLAFPETYYVAQGTGEKEIIRLMVREFRRRAWPVLRQASARVGLAPYEALVLASMIEKETGVARERGLISAVFHNRLEARMRLASDPTVIYGIDSFNGNLTRSDLRTDGPYNTYRNLGLPPTPIANPGLASIVAAVNPAEVDYLYFVAKGDGTHHFSETYEAHSKAVWRFQKRPHRKRSS